MLSDVEILLDKTIIKQQKLETIRRIIKTQDLPLVEEEFLGALNTMMNKISIYDEKNRRTNIVYKRYIHIFSALLDDNKNLLVANIKALNDEISDCDHDTVIFGQLYNMQYYPSDINYEECDYVINAYKILLNYNDFEIDELICIKDSRVLDILRGYRAEILCGKLTKTVVKVEI